MSWLSSVGNLLENLDGQAETVAETVAEQATSTGISNNLRRLNNTIANNASAITSNIAKSGNISRDDDFEEGDDYYDGNSFSSFEDDEEFTTDGEGEDDKIGGANTISTEGDKSGNDGLIANNANAISSGPSSVSAQSAPTTELFQPTNDNQQPDKDSDPIGKPVSNKARNPDQEQQSSVKPIAPEKVNPSNATETPSDTNNTNPKVPALQKLPMKQVERGITLPNQLSPLLQQKASAKQSLVTEASSKTSAPTQNDPGTKKVPEQKQKDETRLFKKQQQQQQQVLASKNKTIQSLQSQLAKLREQVTKGAAENESLNQRTKDLKDKLQSSEREIEAQGNELSKAGDEMEKIRTNAKEELEDLQDDHEDEMEEIQRNHQSALDKMRQEYEKNIAEWKERYESEENLRQQEGGDSIKELQEATKREREALIKLAEVTDERKSLQTKLDLVVGQETTLKQQVESSLESAETVAAREQRARDELDAAAALHTKQMTQRQRREAELEQTILEMGSALTLAKQQLQQQGKILSSPKGKAAARSAESNQDQNDGPNYKEQFEQVTEELETVQLQFTMETQRREALQQQLTEVSEEREQELSQTQSRQHQHDRKVTDLESTIYRLQDSIRASHQQSNASSDIVTNDSLHVQAANTPHKGQPNQEWEGAKQEITNLSEQLFRQQALAKNAKSEILALKGRLQAANTRADDAEKARYDSKYAPTPRSRTYDVEGGNSGSTPPPFSARRRIKGGSSRGVRSIRSALPCFGSGRASAENGAIMEQVALTIDAIDSWMVGTGSFMRHEPFARLGLLMYLMVLHLWSFALVVFHTTEVEHGDFGSMDSNPRHWREHT